MIKPAGLLRELDAFVDGLAGLESAATLQEERASWAAFCLANNPPRPPTVLTEEIDVALANRSLPARIYRPANLGEPAPCVLYLHGGGWVLGDLDTQDAIAWGLALGTGAAVLSLAYRLAPEHPFPAAFDDSYQTLETLCAEPGRHGLDGDRIALCGDSAGGNLALATSVAARDRGGPVLRGQALVYPVVDTDTDRPSYLENAEAPLLSRAEMAHYLDAYLGPLRDDPPPLAMPLRADLGGLPPTSIHAAEFDPLRDEAFELYERLLAAGTPARYRCARGMVHGFIRARLAGPAAAAEFDAVCGFLREVLTRGAAP